MEPPDIDLVKICVPARPHQQLGKSLHLLGPRGLPADIVRTINAHFNEVLKMPDIAARMAQLGIEPIGGDPAVLARQISTDDETFGRLIKEFGIKSE